MTEVFWVFRARCGCPFEVTSAAHSEDQAWRELYPTQLERQVAEHLGVTVEQMPRDRYDAEVHPIRRGGSCPHRWVLYVPAPAPIHSVNGNKPWRVTAEAKRLWRETTYLRARQAKLPRGLARVRIDVVLHFTSNRRRDSANYHPWCVKPIVDALGPERLVKGKAGIRRELGYGLIPDDNPEHLDGPYPVIGPATSEHRLGLAVVHITDLTRRTDGR